MSDVTVAVVSCLGLGLGLGTYRSCGEEGEEDRECEHEHGPGEW
jgi:hypothetical protein